MFKFVWNLSEKVVVGIFLLILLSKLTSSLFGLILVVVIWLMLKPAQPRENCRCGRSRGRCKCSR